MKKLIQKDESEIFVECPISSAEISQREVDYPILPAVYFAKKYNKQLYKPTKLIINGNEIEIQANFCVNPFCRWYGLPQHRYENIKFKPSRYALWGSEPTKTIRCVDVPQGEPKGFTFPNDFVSPLSNWSLALEIKRLADINTVKPVEPDYEFHHVGCTNQDHTPSIHSESFRKRGKSSSNSQKLQCKSCGKITNVLPLIKQSFNYHQKKNDILPTIFMHIVNKTPVMRTLEQLGIGASTYYNKLEWLHRRCLEFLERHETNKLKQMQFDTLWLNTDKFIYFMNNIRKKGYGGEYSEQEKLLMATHVIVTVDCHSRYVFRNDIAYDFNVTPEDVQRDIAFYKEDKLNSFSQKNARYRHSYYGNRKTKKEDLIDDVADDILDKSYLELRKQYVDGLHVNSTYTAYAQYWHLKQLLNVKNLNYITDDDRTLLNGLLRVHSNEIRNKSTHIFLCQLDKNITLKEAYREHAFKKEELKNFKSSFSYQMSNKHAGIMILAEDLDNHEFYQNITVNGELHTIPIEDAPIEHPIPAKGEGIRYVQPYTDLSDLTNLELASKLIEVDFQAINAYFNQIRRRLNQLERPLSTSRGERRAYIYANTNPKYAHYLLTILRTYVNFCLTFKDFGNDVTPAMKLGITDKVFKIEDIIYFK